MLACVEASRTQVTSVASTPDHVEIAEFATYLALFPQRARWCCARIFQRRRVPRVLCTVPAPQVCDEEEYPPHVDR